MTTGYHSVCQFLYREARLLDDRDWDNWIACYSPDATYWMPSWDDGDELVDDPQTQISLIYYRNREGLEDRVFRIRTERSSATMPEPRTTHMLSGIEILEERGSEVDLRYNFNTLSHRYKATSQFFGTIFVTLAIGSDALHIVRKKIVLNNDYIHQVVDIYHV
jgi:benzoate/toluate 1,2-dioxygenase subunit beta